MNIFSLTALALLLSWPSVSPATPEAEHEFVDAETSETGVDIEAPNNSTRAKAMPQRSRPRNLTPYLATEKSFVGAKKASVSDLNFTGWAIGRCYGGKGRSAFSGESVAFLFKEQPNTGSRDSDETETAVQLLRNERPNHFQNLPEQFFRDELAKIPGERNWQTPKSQNEETRGPRTDANGDIYSESGWATKHEGGPYETIRYTYRKIAGDHGEEFVIRIQRESRSEDQGPVKREIEYCF